MKIIIWVLCKGAREVVTTISCYSMKNNLTIRYLAVPFHVLGASSQYCVVAHQMYFLKMN